MKWLEGGDMNVQRKPYIPVYLKVEVRSRFPTRWSWVLRCEANHAVLDQSPDLFTHAEDAWKAGQAALRELTPTTYTRLLAGHTVLEGTPAWQ